MKTSALCWVISLTCLVDAAYGSDPHQTEILSALSRIAHKSLVQRVEEGSAGFLGRPYVLGPLGEGAQGRFDQDPLYRTDVFDCTTYVETVMALAVSRSGTWEEFFSRLNHIRYAAGQIGYFERKHFAEADWVPRNIEAGFLRDITAQVAGNSRTARTEALIDRGNWFRNSTMDDLTLPTLSPEEKRSRLEELRVEGAAYPTERVSLDYLPFGSVHEVADRIPSGTIANLVRVGWYLPAYQSSLIIAHQGFIIRKNGLVYFRHASKPGRRVREELLVNYMRQFSSSSTAKGFQLLEVLDLAR